MSSADKSKLDAFPAYAARSFGNAPGRTLVAVAAAANGFQIDASRDAFATYSVAITCAVQIGVVTNVSGYVVLEVAATNSSTAADWTEIGRITHAENIGLALALSATEVIGGAMSGIIQAGWYARLRSVNVAGTPTYAVHGQQEVKL